MYKICHKDQPDKHLLNKTGFNYSMTWLILLPIVFVGLLATVLFFLEMSNFPRRQRDAGAWVDHTLRVLERAATLEANLATVASEGRGFLIGMQAGHLSAAGAESSARFHAAILKVDGDLDALHVLTADNSSQQQAVDRLKPLIVARIDALKQNMQKAEDGVPIAQWPTHGRQLADQVKVSIEAIRAEELRLLDERGGVERQSTRDALLVLMGCGAAAVMGLVATAMLLFGRGRDRKHAADLQRLNAELEQRVSARTAELTASEAKLRESEASFRHLAENAADMISRVGPDGIRRYTSSPRD